MTLLAERKGEWLDDVMRFPARKILEEVRSLRLRAEGQVTRDAKERERAEIEKQIAVEQAAIDSIRNWNSR